MYENFTLSSPDYLWRRYSKQLIMFKLMLLMSLIFTFSANASHVLAQKADIKVENELLKEVFRLLKEQTDVDFLYTESQLKNAKLVTLDVRHMELREILEICFKEQPLMYILKDNTVLIKHNNNKFKVEASSLFLENEVLQQRVITGRVTDENGAGLTGVSVQVKGVSQGTTTDKDGKYSIVINSDNTALVFSFVGFITQDIAISNSNVMNVELSVDVSDLDEVVIVGYGTQSKRDVSSAIGSLSVKNARIADLPITGPEQVLQGRLSGVTVTQNSGTPGGRSTVRIRGASSITGGNDPLYVIDGVPVNTSNYNGVSGGAVAGNPLSSISPNDIESMEVLKDAASAAIYGSRASNGVILITTKRGQIGAPRISFNSYVGLQKETKRLSLLDGPGWGTLVNEARTNVGLAPYFDDPSSLSSTDWQNVIFRNAGVQNYDLSLSGGTERTQYMISGNYYDQTGVVIGSGFKRGNMRVNIDQRINSRLKSGLSLSMGRSKTDRIDEGGNTGIVSAAIIKSPAVPLYKEDGTLNAIDPYIATSNNPLLMAQEITNYANNDRVIGNAFLSLDIIDGLTLRSSIGIDYLNLEEVLFIPPNDLTAEGRRTNGSGTNGFTQDLGWINENTLNFTRSFTEKHRINALLGYSAQVSRMRRTTASGTNFATESIPTLESASIRNSSSSGGSWGLQSYFSRFNYSFDNKLNIAASFRYDGSSRFSKNNKYGAFPSLSASYNLGQTLLLEDSKWMNDLKFRVSWGRTGNQEIGNFTSRGLSRGGFNYINQSGLAQTQLENPNLEWEATEQTNFGVDWGLLNHRLNVTADYYIKNTNGLLLEVLLPTSSGFTSSIQNVGNVQNKGLELQISSFNINKDNFTWRTDFNISFNRNKVTSLPDGDRPLGFNGYASILKEGYPLGTFYGWKILGVNKETGNYDFVDVDGEGNIPYASTSTDNQVLGSAQPKYIGGITNNFTYKSFDLNIFAHFSYGNQVFNHAEYSYGRMHTWFNSFTRSSERWRKPGDDTWLHRAAWGDPTRNGSVSDRVLEDGSFFKIKAITLGYNVKSPFLENNGVKNVRLYISGQNLFTFTKYTGFDPEVNSFGNDSQLGFDMNAYPQIKTYTFGINLNF